MHATHPTRLCLSTDTTGAYRIIFYLGHQRYRYSHGKAIGLALKPNSHLEPHRSELATELLLAFKQALDRGWRPHQEIRLLTWGDFDEGMTRISLSGIRNKSGRNRIVPIPQYVAMHLPPWGSTPPPSQNILSGKDQPFNADYFKSLWTRYKAQSNLISPDQTLYSFRHTGAINVYEKTGNLRTVQTVMGHASMAVTLGYLRGLEVCELNSESMPSY